MTDSRRDGHPRCSSERVYSAGGRTFRVRCGRKMVAPGGRLSVKGGGDMNMAMEALFEGGLLKKAEAGAKNVKQVRKRVGDRNVLNEVAAYCGVPLHGMGAEWMNKTLKGRIKEANGGAGFVMPRSGDVHVRNMGDDPGWWWTPEGACPNQFWYPARYGGLGGVRRVLLVAGETSALSAAWALHHRPDWLILGNTSRVFPTDADFSLIRNSGWKAVLWGGGEEWEKGATEALEGVPRTIVNHPLGDARAVWLTVSAQVPEGAERDGAAAREWFANRMDGFTK